MKNIVLIGMMGSGKTTCGRLLAQRLDCPFVDCDQRVEELAGRTIPQIFEVGGEEVFRTLESRVVAATAARQGQVIATGGGAVLRQENVDALRRTGAVVFLDRPVEDILAGVSMEGRPLGQGTAAQFEDTFIRRLPFYQAAADLTVRDFSAPEATVEAILAGLADLPKRILVINGPNLNLLGQREPDIYGRQDYDYLCGLIAAHAKALGVRVDCWQSNHEGAIIDRIQQAQGVYDGIVINPGAYTHYSYAIHDALKAITVPAWEVHISDIHSREAFRAVSVTAPACRGQVYGQGLPGYLTAMDALLEVLA